MRKVGTPIPLPTSKFFLKTGWVGWGARALEATCIFNPRKERSSNLMGVEHQVLGPSALQIPGLPKNCFLKIGWVGWGSQNPLKLLDFSPLDFCKTSWIETTRDAPLPCTGPDYLGTYLTDLTKWSCLAWHHIQRRPCWDNVKNIIILAWPETIWQIWVCLKNLSQRTSQRVKFWSSNYDYLFLINSGTRNVELGQFWDYIYIYMYIYAISNGYVETS